MRLNRTGSTWTRTNRNGVNENWEILERSLLDIDGIENILKGFDGRQLIQKSYNVFNKDAVVKGRLDTSTGELIDFDSTWWTSEFIEIVHGKEIQIKPVRGVTALYDSNFNFVRQITASEVPIITDLNIRYLRTSMREESIADKLIYFGGEDLPYVNYGYVYSPSFKNLIQQIVDDSVINAPEKVPEYTNLFNKNAVVVGLLDGSTGELIDSESSWRTSEYIEVNAGKALQIKPSRGVTVLYDADFNYVRQVSASEEIIYIDSNVRYIRTTMGSASVDGKYVYLGINDMGYYPYGEGPGASSDVKPYINLFDKNAVVNGRIDTSNGQVVDTESTWRTSDFIEIESGKAVQIKPSRGVTALYDSSSSFIRQVPASENPVITDANARYLRTTMSVNSLADKLVYIGTNDMAYYPFGEGLGSDEDSAPKRILIIGNSFSVDTFTHLHDICKSAGINIVIGVAHDAGAGLNDYITKINNNETIHSYYKWSNAAGYVRIASPIVDVAIKDEPWDIVLFQQMSTDSLDYSTFQPHLNNLKSYVKTNISNPNVRFGINAIWSRAVESPLVGTREEQIRQYNLITENYKQAMFDSDLEILIPTGTAIQNGRSNEYLSQVGIDLTRDNSHLDEPVGRYIAAMTVFQTLFGDSPHGDVSFKTAGVNGYLMYLAKAVAKQAVINPYKISEL